MKNITAFLDSPVQFEAVSLVYCAWTSTQAAQKTMALGPGINRYMSIVGSKYDVSGAVGFMAVIGLLEAASDILPDVRAEYTIFRAKLQDPIWNEAQLAHILRDSAGYIAKIESVAAICMPFFQFMLRNMQSGAAKKGLDGEKFAQGVRIALATIHAAFAK